MDATAPDSATGKPADDAPRGFEKWKRVLLGIVSTFGDQDTSLRCAGTAFFGFLSFFPAIATAILIYGIFADLSTIQATLDVAATVLPSTVLGFVDSQLERLIAQPRFTLGLGLLISIPLALWSASRGIDALLYAMASVRHQTPQRGFLKKVAYSVGLSVAGAVFVVLALLTVAGLPALIPFPTGEEVLVMLLRWPVLLALTTGVLAVLYRWGPDRHPRKFAYIWPGAILASLVWLVAGAVFSIYVENFSNFEASFGSVTAAVVLLLWMYNSAQIFVLGAAFNTHLQFVETGTPIALRTRQD